MDLLRKVKVELWVLCLIGFLFLMGIIGFGSLVRHEIVASVSRVPILSGTALFLAEIPSNFRAIIRGLSYDLEVQDQRFPSVSGFQGKFLENESYLLLSKYDGEKKKPVVELIDLRSFEVKKTWEPDIDQINALVDTSLPEFEFLERDHNSRRYLMNHPILSDDGGLIFKHNSPLVRIDKNSELVWQNQEDIFHHSIEQDHEGNLWVPTSVYPYQVDNRYVGMEYGNYIDDAITKVSKDGEILFQKSVTNIFIENNLKYLLFVILSDRFIQDPIHLNDIQPVLTDGKYWKRGDIFLSLRNLSMVILYRPSTNKIIWKGVGQFAAQHDVDILDDARISIFNNNAKNFYGGDKVDGNSEVVIYDFKTDSYSKYLNESLKRYDVQTVSGGQSQILNNGDLFFREGLRLLYFSKDGSLEWQYINRAKNGKIYLTGWSRILYSEDDVKRIHEILKTTH